jgi:anti-anti-sigma factor
MAEQSNRGNSMNPSETYKITLTRLGAVTIFNIKGDMTAFSEPVFNDAYRQAMGQETKKILFNFNRNAYINSAGIAIFIQIIAQTIKRNQRIGITGLSKHFIKIFDMLGITKYSKIHDNIQRAIEALDA